MRGISQFFRLAFQNPARCSLAITSLYFFLGWLFFTPFFQTNDDMVMNWITRGVGLVDRPSEFLLTMNVALGILLENLNLAFPQVPWYGLGLYGLFFLSVWALLAAFLSKDRSSWACLILAVVGTPVFFQCYAWPQYTIFCFLAVQAGIFLLLDPVKPRFLSFAITGFLISAASLARLDAALFSICSGAVYVVQKLRVDGGVGSSYGKLGALSASALLVLFGACFNHFYISAHPDWKEAKEYYDTRFSVAEIKATDYERQEPAFHSVGWGPEDYQMFLEGFYEGPSFSLENLKKLDGLLKMDPQNKLWDLEKLLENPIIPFLLCGFFVGAIVSLRMKTPPWAPVSWAVFLVLLLVWFEKIVARVIWPQIFFAVLLTAFSPRPDPGKKGTGPKRHWELRVLFSALVFFGTAKIIENYSRNRPGKTVEKEVMNTIRELSPRKDQIFIVWGPSFPTAFPVFQVDDSMRDFRLLWMHWFERTPYGDERLRQFHIHDFIKDTIDRPDVFLISNDQSHLFENYYKYREGIAVSRKLVLHGYFDVFQMVSEKIKPKNTDSL